MSKQDIYVFFLCLIVFIMLTVLSIFMLATIVKLSLKCIVHGAEDEDIRKEIEQRAKQAKAKKVGAVIDFIVSAVFTCALVVVFTFSLVLNAMENTYFDNIPTVKVVQSASMSYKHEKNTYLEKNGLHDQFDAFDLILTYKLPDEKDLKLYDVVVYEVDDILLVHRIVGIEEPNAQHPNERYFLLQGDAVENPDRFPVRYSQMRGIYRGERIPFVGSFINFMQSPAGWLCVLLAVGAMIATPIIERILERARQERYALISLGAINAEEMLESVPATPAPAVLVSPAPVVVVPVAVAQETPAQEELAPTEEIFAQEETPVAVSPVEEIAVSQDVAEEMPAEEPAPSGFGFSGKRDMRTFKQKLAETDESVLAKYRDVVELIARIDRARGQDSRRFESFKRGTSGIARFALRGKTLNIYLGLDPKAYQDTKYVFEDVSSVKAFELYPMRMKLTSDRQVRWAKELIEQMAKANGWTVLEKPDYADVFEDESEELRLVEVDVDALKEADPFAKLRGKRGLTFKQKLAVADDAVREKYQEITETLTAIERVRTTDSRRFETYKRGNVALARIAIKGKTLNVYLGLDPKEYEDTKYIYTDESDVKAFERYPMRVKVTSARKAKWVKELVAQIVKENGLEWKE